MCWHGGPHGTRDDLAELRSTITLLEYKAELAGRANGKTIDVYRPAIAGDITSFDALTAAILQQLPGVAQVQVAVWCHRPSHRIIHFRDWHHTAKGTYTAGPGGTVRPVDRR